MSEAAPHAAVPEGNREERYQALIVAARGLFPLVTLDELVAHLLFHGPTILRCAACSIALPDAKTRELAIHAARAGADVPLPPIRLPWDKGIAGRVFQSGLAACLDDPARDPEFLAAAELPPGLPEGAVLCVPLVYREERLGVFQAIAPLGRPGFDAFDRTFIDGIASMATSAIMRLEREGQIKIMARVAGELAAAEEIQKALLPPPEVRLPHGLLLARYQAARSLGGDFYEIEPLHDGSILVAVGDVSGKGIPAALTTAQVTTEIDAMAARPVANLAEFVGVLNRHLCARISAGRFVATTFLRYVPTLGRMEVVCAGQYAPWRNQNGHWRRLEIPGSPPLGVDPDALFHVETLRCAPGERWALVTDGITEGRNREKEEYGLDRFEASLIGADPFRQIERAWEAWGSFVVQDALHDDACLALFTCLPPEAIRLEACASACKEGRAFVEGWALAAGFGDEERGRIVLGADETFTNLLRHALGGKDHGKPIFLSGALDRDELAITLRTEAPFVDITKLEPRPIGSTFGGMGLHCIRQVFDRIECRPVEGLTETTLVKKLPGM